MSLNRWCYTQVNPEVMDKKVNKVDLSLVPEIRNLHPAFFHSFENHHEPRSPSTPDSPDLPPTIAFKRVASSSTSPGLVERLIGVAKDNYRSVFLTIIIVLVILLETALDNALFKCPCSTKGENIGYSVIFVAGPSITLLILGILGNNSTWRLVTGCWYRARDATHGCYRGCFFVTDVLAKAMFAPFAWITYGFIDGRFYVCAVSDDPCERGNTTVTISADEARQDAQIIGYVLLMTGSGFILLCILFQKGFSKYSYEQDDYIQIYRAVERVEMQKQLEAQAHEVAQRVVAAFLHKQSRDKSDWDLLTSGDRVRPPGGRDGNLPWTPMQRIFQREHVAENERKTSTQTQTSVNDESDGTLRL